MDLLLTHGYFLEEDAHEKQVMRPYPPLGLLCLSAYLKRKGFKVELFDSTFHHFDDLVEYLRRQRPPVVGIYANLMTRKRVIDLAGVCREEGLTVVCGGPEPANYAEEYLSRGVDVVVVGEGELTLEDLLRHLPRRGTAGLETVEGIVFRSDAGRVIRTKPRAMIPDLDALPFPDREAVEMREYLHRWRSTRGFASVSLITSRGCPYTCTWCSHGVFGHSYRSRSPKNVADEVELIRDLYRPEMLWFADDVFTINKRRFLALADELIGRDLRIPFEAISREDRLDEEIVRKLADMNCRRIWIGSESGSQRILDAMERRTDARRVRDVVRLLREHGIETGMFIMLGYEGEEMTDLELTVELLKDASPDVFLTTLSYPIKGTPYFETVRERIVGGDPWERSSDRNLLIAGRRAGRYYDFATRWMVSEVQLHRLCRDPRGSIPGILKAYLNSRIGFWGMKLAGRRHESRSSSGSTRATA